MKYIEEKILTWTLMATIIATAIGLFCAYFDLSLWHWGLLMVLIGGYRAVEWVSMLLLQNKDDWEIEK